VRLAFVPLVFLIMIIAVVLTFSVNIFGSAETTANMTGDTYEEEYTALTDLEHVGMAELEVIGFLAVLGGVLVIGWLFFH